MKKRMGIIILLPIMVAIFVFMLAKKGSQDCQEIAFQNSPLYGHAPRRYFEVLPLKKEPGFLSELSYSYIVAMGCDPILLMKTSSSFCSIGHSEEIRESDKPKYRKLIKGCTP